MVLRMVGFRPVFNRLLYMERFIFSTFVSLLIFICPAHSQKYLYKHFQITDGLPHGYVYTLNQSHQGFLWIGTAEGLCKYDGKTFTNYTVSDSLVNNFVNTSMIDHKDRLWIGHYQGGITLLDNQNFVKITKGSVPDSRINKIYETKDGNIWVATQTNGLLKIDQNLYVSEVKGVSKDEIIWDLCELSDHTFMLATNEGVSMVDTKKNIEVPIHEFEGVQVLNINKINTKNFLVATEYEGIFLITFDNEKYILKMLLEQKTKISEKLVFSKLDPDGTLWISRTESGLSKNMIKKDSILELEIFNNDKGLKFNHFRSMLKDREGNLWIGSFGNGLYELSNQAFMFYNLNSDFTDYSINCISGNDNKSLLIGFNNEAGQFDYSNDSIKKYLPEQFKNTLNGNSVFSICKDRDGNTYFTTQNKGVLRQSKGNEKIESWFTFNDLFNPKVFHIKIDKNDNVWLSTENGVYKINRKTKSYQRFSMEDGLAHNIVYYCYEDTQGSMWFATHGSGISKYSYSTIKTIASPLLTSAIDINAILEDKEGNIWFGTYGQGLFRCDRNGELTKVYTKKEGLGSNFCYSLVIDAKNNLLIGHKNGITKINLTNDKLSFIGNVEMLNGVEINLNATYIDNQKNVWFGTNQGLLKYDPFKDKTNVNEPVTNITGLKLFFAEPDWKKLKYKANRFSLPTQVTFSHSNNHITFNYIGVCLSAPEKVRYKYHLQGYDNTWSLETDETYATYTNLPPGEYTFEVLSMNNDGLWNTKPATYQFGISPPFWKTTGFYILVSTASIAILYLIFYFRTRALQSQKKILEQEKTKLENEIHERKITERKLKESEDLLKTTNDELNNLVWRSCHDLRGPSSTIQGLAQIALLDELANKKDEYLGMIQRTAQKLDAVLKDFFRVSDIKNMELNPEQIEFEWLINSIMADLSAKYRAEYILNLKINELNPLMADRILIDLILRNILDNAFCFSNGTRQVDINVKGYNNQVVIIISDKGDGIPENVTGRVFEMFYRASVKSKGNGLGLYTAKKAVEMLHGKISLFTKEQEGTTIMIRLNATSESTITTPS